MCGIYGTTLYYQDHQVKAKLERTAFRGPDKMRWNYYEANSKPVILGHNRLSIIDLDSRADQPLSYMDSVHIVFNGEIYNFKEIKKELVKQGFKFHTTSDTEVICAAYLAYGTDCVKHFNGMFAFVVYDKIKQLFFGARDRLGQKPFYYYRNGLDFEFSSQISSIQLFNKKLSISKKAIAYYLAWGAVPDSLSIFNEIKKLPAGHSFTFDLNSGVFETQKYWDIDYTGEHKFEGSYDHAKGILEDLVLDAVSKRLFADVPVGVFLSGGIDSSLVAALASKSSVKKVKTFSVKFHENGFDESHYAQQVASSLKTDHHIIECDYKEGINLIDNFNYYYDEPFADSSAIPSMLLAKYTRKHVTVALSGDGGDESFIGYPRYNLSLQKRLYHLPYFIRKIASQLLRVAPNYRLKVISKALKIKDLNTYYLYSMVNIDNSWIQRDVDFFEINDRKYIEHNSKNVLERVSDFDLKTYLNWDINTKVDRATMAYSLEARAPLMDFRVVDFACSLPTDFKFKKGNQKRILKDVLYSYVPESIFNRPKAGFAVPVSEWFKKDLKEYVLTELNHESLMSIPNINVPKVEFMIDQHMKGSWNRSPIIWKLLVLKQWLKNNTNGYSIK